MRRTQEEIRNRAWVTEPRKRKPTPRNYRGVKAFYAKYKELYWKDPLNRIKPAIFKKLITEIHREIMTAIAEEGFEFLMPYQTGMLSITMKDPAKLETLESGDLNRSIDMNATLEWWARDDEAYAKKSKIYHTNLHSNGRLCKIKYTTYRHAYFKGKMGVKYLPSRNFQQLAGHVMKNKSQYPNAVYYDVKVT